jgi:hypothetical protein
VAVCVCVPAGREPGAAPDVTQLGEERSTELSALVNNFILRRWVEAGGYLSAVVVS